MRHPLITEDLESILSDKLDWNRFDGKTILISGASGMLPAYMVETLLFLNEVRPSCGLRVVGLVRNLERAVHRFGNYIGRSDLTLLHQDVCDPLPSSLRADFVVHAASQASPQFFGKDPIGTLKANVLGTMNMLDFAKRSQSERVLYFSSSEIYGAELQPSCFLRESDYGYLDPLLLRSCYGESKRMGENMCVTWATLYNISAVIIRPFHTYGPGMRMDDGRVFADFVADVIARQPIRIKSAGTAVRAYCYLADAARGYFAVLLNGGSGEAYNVGNPFARASVLELAHLVASLVPEAVTSVIVDSVPQTNILPNPATSVLPCIDKIKGLGWEPRVGLQEGFKRTITVCGACK